MREVYSPILPDCASLHPGYASLTDPAAGFAARERLGRHSHAERGNDQNWYQKHIILILI